jgi:hypothetical protein
MDCERSLAIMRRRPAFLTIFHTAWIVLASAFLLAGCTVVPAPVGYSYQAIPCPPGVAPPAAAPGQTPPPDQSNAPPPQVAPTPGAAGAPPATGQCYAAVPNDYTYAAYPGYSYPYPYAPYYGPYPYGYWSGGVFFYGHRHRW